MEKIETRKKNSGQGAIEYLLIISAAVVVAVIVIAVIMGIGGTQKGAADQKTLEMQDIQKCAGTSNPSNCCAAVGYTPTSIKYGTTATGFIKNCNLVPGCKDANLNSGWTSCR